MSSIILPPGIGVEEVSDGYHTFEELYEFRMLYSALLFNEWAKIDKYQVHKSFCHHDGNKCFEEGWFIVAAMLPLGQISNHYESADWDYFQVPISNRVKWKYDYHTSKDVLARLADCVLLTPPSPL